MICERSFQENQFSEEKKNSFVGHKNFTDPEGPENTILFN